MNGKLQGRIWDANLPRNHKFLLALLAWYANEQGENIYPAMATIARRLDLGERQVIRLMQQVQDKGYVQLVKRGGGPNRTNNYRIVVDALPGAVNQASSPPTAERLTFSKTGPEAQVTFQVATRDISGGTGDILRAIPDIQMSPKIAIEHKTEIKNTAVTVWELVSTHLKAKASAIKSQIDGGEPDPTRIDTQRYRTYISTLHAVSLKDEMLILGVPHLDFAAMIERFKPRILDAAKECGAGFTDIEFVIRTRDYE